MIVRRNVWKNKNFHFAVDSSPALPYNNNRKQKRFDILIVSCLKKKSSNFVLGEVQTFCSKTSLAVWLLRQGDEKGKEWLKVRCVYDYKRI